MTEPDAMRKSLEPICLKAICTAEDRCACANKDWKWRDDRCEADIARVKAILDCIFSALPPAIDKTKLYTVLSKSIPADMIDGIWQELNQ